MPERKERKGGVAEKRIQQKRVCEKSKKGARHGGGGERYYSCLVVVEDDAGWRLGRTFGHSLLRERVIKFCPSRPLLPDATQAQKSSW